MAVVLPIEALAGIGTYDDLVAAVDGWLDRDDLSELVPSFVSLAESRLNRLLRVPAMETRATITATDEAVDLPSDLLRIRSVYVSGTPNRALNPVSIDALPSTYSGAAGIPQSYAISGSTIYLAPPPASDTDLVITYWEKIPALGNVTQTNWLITRHPDVYFYGTLLAAEAYLANDNRLPIWTAAFENAIAEIQDEGNKDRYGGTPRMLSSVANICGARA